MLERSITKFENSHIDHEVLGIAKNELYNIQFESYDRLQEEGIEYTHYLMNHMFCLDHKFTPLLTSVPMIELPQFTYYKGISKPRYNSVGRTYSHYAKPLDDSESMINTPKR